MTAKQQLAEARLLLEEAEAILKRMGYKIPAAKIRKFLEES